MNKQNLNDVAPIVDEWIRARGTSMNGSAYAAALDLAAHVKAALPHLDAAQAPIIPSALVPLLACWEKTAADERAKRRVDSIGFAAGIRSCIDGLRAFIAAPVAPGAATFQQRVKPWMLECFGAEIAADRVERNHRFIEEATELVQACGMTASEAHQLVDYTFGRPIGEPAQEVGGVMVTLAALCLANGLDMHAAGETELERISMKETAAKIRAKQAAKPKHSPLPEAPAAHSGESESAKDRTIAFLRDQNRRIIEAAERIRSAADPQASATLTAYDLLAAVTSRPDLDDKGREALRHNVLERGEELTLAGGDFETMAALANARGNSQ